jgi:hypothetical protein
MIKGKKYLVMDLKLGQENYTKKSCSIKEQLLYLIGVKY